MYHEFHESSARVEEDKAAVINKQPVSEAVELRERMPLRLFREICYQQGRWCEDKMYRI